MEGSQLEPITSHQQFSTSWIQDMLQAKFADIRKVESWQVRLPESRTGYLSEICYVKATCKNVAGSIKEKEFVVKFLPNDEDRLKVVTDLNLSEREMDFYQYSDSSYFKTFCRKSNVPSPVPEVYWMKMKGNIFNIVMEDLSASGFKSSVAVAGNSLAEIKYTLKSIAVVHAAGLAAARRTEKQALHLPYNYTALKCYFLKGVDIQMKLFSGTPTAATFQSLVPSVDEVLTVAQKYPLVDTVIHGDLWTGNVMFSDDNQVRIFDWQLAAVGNPVCDIICLLLLSAEPCVYSRHLNEVIQCYWESFKDAMRKNEVSVGISLEDIARNVENLWMYGYMFLTASLADLMENKHIDEKRLKAVILFLEKRGVFENFLFDL